MFEGTKRIQLFVEKRRNLLRIHLSFVADFSYSPNPNLTNCPFPHNDFSVVYLVAYLVETGKTFERSF